MVQTAYTETGVPRLAYVPALDGLRAVSILVVVLSHAGLDRVLPGAFGVTLFFFISGLLITRQLLQGLATAGRIDFGGFYLRRALRLLPAALVYVLVAGVLFQGAGGAISPPGWVAAVFYGANVYDLWAGYRSVLSGVRHPFNILWSLAIEEHFYLAWPAVLAGLWRWRVAVAGVGVLCVSALVWRYALFGQCFGHGAPWVCGVPPHNPLWKYNRLYMGTDTRFDSILFGALLALVEQRAWPRRLAGARVAILAALVLLAASFVLPGPLMRHVLRTSLQGVALLVLVPACLDARHAVARLLASGPAVLVGRLSYSLYLWHWGAFAFADWAMPGDSRRLVLLGLPLAWVLAILSYVCIEQPMLRLRRRFGSHAPLDVLGASSGTAGETPYAATTSA